MKTPASLISDGYTIGLTPWWRYYLRKLFPFKRKKVVLLEDVMPLLDALAAADVAMSTCKDHCYSDGTLPHQTYDSAQMGFATLDVRSAYTKFIFKHPLP